MSQIHKHYIEYCKVCNKVISQCRCFSTDKLVRYGICDSCEKKDTYQTSREDYFNQSINDEEPDHIKCPFCFSSYDKSEIMDNDICPACGEPVTGRNKEVESRLFDKAMELKTCLRCNHFFYDYEEDVFKCRCRGGSDVTLNNPFIGCSMFEG